MPWNLRDVRGIFQTALREHAASSMVGLQQGRQRDSPDPLALSRDSDGQHPLASSKNYFRSSLEENIPTQSQDSQRLGISKRGKQKTPRGHRLPNTYKNEPPRVRASRNHKQ